MAKIRIVDGVELPKNLYRRSPGKWRYRRPDGSWYCFNGEAAEAAEAATELNRRYAEGTVPAPQKETVKLGRLDILRHVNDYIELKEYRNKNLPKKDAWKNQCGSLRNFAKAFSDVPISSLTYNKLQTWWDKLTPSAQRSRRAEMRRLMNYAAAEGLTPKLKNNPFTVNDSEIRIENRNKEPKVRRRLDLDGFWTIYDAAPAFLQVAMAISLVTTMRRGDICELRLDEHIDGSILRKKIAKSHAQLSEEFALTGGKASPASLEWDLQKHPLLRSAIKRARELAMKNQGCPYVVNHRYQRRHKSKGRNHCAQVLPDYLTREFERVRDETGAWQFLKKRQRPTFHEVRALASWLLHEAGYSSAEVGVGMAHTDEKITRTYQAGHGEDWTRIDLVMPAGVLGRSF